MLERVVDRFGLVVVLGRLVLFEDRVLVGRGVELLLVDLVLVGREIVLLRVVDLVRVELIRPLAFLWMPVLMENSSAAEPSHLAVVGEAPRERCKVSVVTAEPVAAETPRTVHEGIDHLQVVQAQDDITLLYAGPVSCTSWHHAAYQHTILALVQ